MKPRRRLSRQVAHRHYDTFELPEAPEPPGGLLPDQLTLSFSTDREGNIASVAVPLEPLVKEIAFTRIAAGDDRPPRDRKSACGTSPTLLASRRWSAFERISDIRLAQASDTRLKTHPGRSRPKRRSPITASATRARAR